MLFRSEVMRDLPAFDHKDPEVKEQYEDVHRLIKATGVKPKLLKDYVSEVAHKPPGKISIARSNDEREAIDPGVAAGQDFAEDPAEDFTP